MDSRALIVNVARGLVALAILAVFLNNLISQIKNVSLVTQTLSVERRHYLVPPALTFCITRQVTYTFTLEVYGNVVATGTSPQGYIDTFTDGSAELGNIAGQVYKCWVIKTPNNEASIVDPSPNPLIDDMRFNYTRIFDTPGKFQSADPIVLNVFDPLKQNTNFKARNLLYLEADVNRAISFSRTESISLNKKNTSDISFTLVDEFRNNNTMTTPNNATSSVRINPETFEVNITTDITVATPWQVVINSITLLGVLFGIFFNIVGKGRYRPWGLINYLLRYFPVEHIKPKVCDLSTQEEGLKEGLKGTVLGNPSVPEILKIYLDKYELARYKI